MIDHKSTALEVQAFLSRASDDACCRWICMTAGQRTKAQEAGLALYLEASEVSRARTRPPHPSQVAGILQKVS